MRPPRILALLYLLGVATTSVVSCAGDDVGTGHCVVTEESARLRSREGLAAGDLAQADTGCLADELLICGNYNSRHQFVSNDCAEGVGAPEGDD